MSREALRPAVHPSGGEYRWILGCGPGEISPPPAPSGFLNQLDPRRSPAATSADRGGRRR